MNSEAITSPRGFLPVRIWKRARREAEQLIQLAYLYLFAIPTCWFKGIVSFPLSICRGYCSFLLLSGAKVVKLSMSRNSTIGWEYANYVEMVRRQPELAAILPQYTYSRGIFLTTLACERLMPLTNLDVLPSAVEARKCLDRSIRTGTRLSLAQCPQIVSGLQCLAKEFGLDTATVMQARVNEYLLKGEYSVGLAHGDFHSRNIMCDSAGRYRLIDLDCVRLEGVTEFDGLYFSLEQKWSTSGDLWIETLGNCFLTNGSHISTELNAFGIRWADGLGLAYFLDRVGQDFVNYEISYPREKLASAVDAFQQGSMSEPTII